MNIFHENHIEFIKRLKVHNVEFLIVGGYAVNFYGYRRGTGDMDIWLKPDNVNKDKFISALKNIGIESEDIDYLNTLNFEKHLAFHIDEEPERIDFLTYISGVEWANAIENCVYSEIDSIKIPIIHRNHLIESKINTGRLQDQADVEGLQNVKTNE